MYRSRERDGRTTRAVSWFPGSALIQESEVLGRDGTVENRFPGTDQVALGRASPTDRAHPESRLAPWAPASSQATLMEEVSIARALESRFRASRRRDAVTWTCHNRSPLPHADGSLGRFRGSCSTWESTVEHVWSFSGDGTRVQPGVPRQNPPAGGIRQPAPPVQSRSGPGCSWIVRATSSRSQDQPHPESGPPRIYLQQPFSRYFASSDRFFTGAMLRVGGEGGCRLERTRPGTGSDEPRARSSLHRPLR